MYLSHAKLASFVLGGSAKWICHAALTAVGDSCAHWLWRQWAYVPRWGLASDLHGSVRTTDKSYCCLPSFKAHALTPGPLCSTSMYAGNNNEKLLSTVWVTSVMSKQQTQEGQWGEGQWYPSKSWEVGPLSGWGSMILGNECSMVLLDFTYKNAN